VRGATLDGTAIAFEQAGDSVRVSIAVDRAARLDVEFA
jgi:hypothetical protein